MRSKKSLTILAALLVAIMMLTLAACNNDTDLNKGGGGKTPTTSTGTRPKVLADLVDYSLEAKYYNVADTNSTFGETQTQRTLLQTRIEGEKKDEAGNDIAFEDMSVPVKIFTNSAPETIITKMGVAGMTKDHMIATVNYLAGNTQNQNFSNVQSGGAFLAGEGWSFFDDSDYLEKLNEIADDDSTAPDSERDTNDDNVQRQRRKIMKKVFAIGMSGDEFARFVIEELLYAQEITHSMNDLGDSNYDKYVKEQLSYDTLVYFKSFNEFYSEGTQKPKTVQLYGYYYNYNQAAYNNLSDDEFEKQLRYSHMKTFSDTEWLENLALQRKEYEGSYRYDAKFYQTFYNVHLQFQSMKENHDRAVYGIDYPNTDHKLTSSSEARYGLNAGFAQQLTMTDIMYEYSMNESAMKAYNAANTTYENKKNSTTIDEKEKDEAEWKYDLERMKMVDYILSNMNNTELSKVLVYQIYTYSADLLGDIQTERKNYVLDGVDLNKATASSDANGVKKYTLSIGKGKAIEAQIARAYASAGISNQIKTAQETANDWDERRAEVKEVLNMDNYNGLADGTAKLEKLENLVVKKVWDCGSTDDNVCPDHPGLGHIGEEKTYATDHAISRFLSNHEDVLLHMAGQVKVELARTPADFTTGAPANTNDPITITYYSLSTAGSYCVGVPTRPESQTTGIEITAAMIGNKNYLASTENITFSSGDTLAQGRIDADELNFGDGSGSEDVNIRNKVVNELGTTGRKATCTYTFVGYFLDKDLKYIVDPEEAIEHDLLLYPGYDVVVTIA